MVPTEEGICYRRWPVTDRDVYMFSWDSKYECDIWKNMYKVVTKFRMMHGIEL